MAISQSTHPHYAAQDILSRRDHSEWELKEKLAKKKFSPAEIQETIHWLKGKKLINDQAFAKRYIEGVIHYKAVGPRYLAHKLKAKRINQVYIDAALQEVIGDDKEKALMAKAAAAWQKSHPKYAQDKARLSRFLLSRGFSGHVLSRLDDNLD